MSLLTGACSSSSGNSLFWNRLTVLRLLCCCHFVIRQSLCTLVFFSEILKQDRFRSYSGTRQLLLFGVTEWCLCRQCLQVLYQCLTECWIENSVLWLAQWNWPISIWFVDPDVGCVSLHVYFSVFWPCEYSVLWLRSVSRFLHGLVGISLKEMV